MWVTLWEDCEKNVSGDEYPYYQTLIHNIFSTLSSVTSSSSGSGSGNLLSGSITGAWCGSCGDSGLWLPFIVPAQLLDVIEGHIDDCKILKYL